MKLTWMRNAGNIDGKCNVGSSFIKAVMPGVWLTRRIMYCHHMQPNFAEFGLENIAHVEAIYYNSVHLWLICPVFLLVTRHPPKIEICVFTRDTQQVCAEYITFITI